MQKELAKGEVAQAKVEELLKSGMTLTLNDPEKPWTGQNRHEIIL